MFLIFKIFPDWIWWLGFLTGLFSLALAYLPPLKPYALLLKIFGSALVLSTIFIFGMLWSDSAWKQAAQELQARVDVAEAKSQTVNETIRERVVYKTQVVRQRGEENIKYITREVVKYDNSCVIPPEFVQAHNTAAEKP
jgi:tRNA/tmRNA/rRNA uracil-C5-methylase (TrmA/RlmC/RlmD family)